MIWHLNLVLYILYKYQKSVGSKTKNFHVGILGFSLYLFIYLFINFFSIFFGKKVYRKGTSAIFKTFITFEPFELGKSKYAH